MITFSLTWFCDGASALVVVNDPNNSNVANDTFVAELYDITSGSTLIDSYSPVLAGPGPQYAFFGLTPSRTYQVVLTSQGDGTDNSNSISVGSCCDLSASTIDVVVTDASDCNTADGQIAVTETSSSSNVEARLFRFDTGTFTSWQALPYTFTGLNDGRYRVETQLDNNSSCDYDEIVNVGPACCINTPTINVQDAVNSQSTGYIKFTHNQSGYEYGITASGGVIGDVSTWQTNKFFIGLASGSYLLWVRKITDTGCNSSFAFTVNNDVCGDYTLNISLVSKTDESGPNTNNGSIQLSGNTNYPQLDALGNTTYPITYSLSGQMIRPAQNSAIFENLEPGNYTATATNAGGCTNTLNFDIVSGDIPLSPVAEVPKLNSIRFSRDIQPDYISTFKDEDVLNKDQYFEGFVKPFCYPQVFVKNETIRVQIRTNYEYNYLQVKTRAGQNFGTSVISDLKVQNIGLTDNLSVDLAEASATETFVLFTSGDLPTWAEVGQVITLSDTVNINGVYTVTEVSNIGYNGFPYVKINASVGTALGTDTGTLTTTYNAFDYNIHEFTFSVNLNGTYYIEIFGSDPDYTDYLWKSDYIYITDNQSVLRNHVHIEYWNSTNDFGMDYTTGIKNKIRLYGSFFLPAPAGEDDLVRNSDDEWIKIESDKRTRRLLQVKQITGSLVEKINYIFGHDNVYVNGYEVATDENVSVNALGKSQYVNAEINLEIKNYING